VSNAYMCKTNVVVSNAYMCKTNVVYIEPKFLNDYIL